ncbi:MAG: hypothetical protein K1X53_01765, partial [Candidatus Sumerlaeaceae bacterium]|nr:hypothetical protein [Candidatus Sumerlaeaceae bacterium]
VIDQLRAAGFEFVTVSELLGYEPVKPLSELAASMGTGTSATVAAMVVPAASPDADVAPLPAPKPDIAPAAGELPDVPSNKISLPPGGGR